MNKPIITGNPIVDNYLKTSVGQSELKTVIEKIKSIEPPSGLVLTEVQYIQIASVFLKVEEKIAYDNKLASYKLETVNLIIWFAKYDRNGEATLKQEKNKVNINYMLPHLFQRTFKEFKVLCDFELKILGLKDGINIACNMLSNYQKAKLIVRWKRFISIGELHPSIIKPLEAIRNFIYDNDLRPAQHKIRPNKIIARHIYKAISSQANISQRQHFIYIYKIMHTMGIEASLSLRYDSEEKHYYTIKDYLSSDSKRENEEEKEHEKQIKEAERAAMEKQ